MSDNDLEEKACLPVPEQASGAEKLPFVPQATSTILEPPIPIEGAPPFFEWTEERYFQLYLMQRKGFSESRNQSFLRFDQTVVTVAIGAVALSVAFLEKQPVPRDSLIILFLSWSACIAAVISILASVLTSSKADSAQIKSLDECMRTGTPDEKRARQWNRWTYFLNSLGLTFCVVGVIGLIIFGVVTLDNKEDQPLATRKDLPKPPSKLPLERSKQIHEEQRLPVTSRIEKAAPAEDIAGPFNKEKVKKRID